MFFEASPLEIVLRSSDPAVVVVPISKSKSQEDKILGVLVEVIFTAIWTCPPVQSGLSCLILIPRSKYQSKFHKYLPLVSATFQYMFPTYSANNTSPNHVLYTAFGSIVLLTRFPLISKCFLQLLQDTDTCVVMCQNIGWCLWSLSVGVDTAVRTIAKHCAHCMKTGSVGWTLRTARGLHSSSRRHYRTCLDIASNHCDRQTP